MNGASITFRVPEERKTKAEAKCKREDITLSQILRRCLREWVKDEPPTKESD
jgi:hypothetical protein